MATEGPTPWPRPDRRQEPRAAVSVGAQIAIAGRVYLGLIRDLSPAGAYVELIDGDPFPHEGECALLIAPCEPIRATIRRKRLDDEGAVCGLGLEFLAVPASAAERLAGLLRPEG